MHNIFAIWAEMFSYTFLVRAVIVGALVSICAALLGVSLVLKRYSMIGDGLSHVGFGALALATALNAAPLTVSIPVVVAAAFLLLRLSENSKIQGDAAIALISTASLAVGVVIISQTTGMNTDVCNYLFGSILAMNKTDVYLSIALSITVLVLFILFYHKLFAITFDETFAKAGGVNTGIYNMLIAFLTAITIVLGMRMMGAMLISSLIIFPALTAMRVFKTFRSVTICAALVSVFCFFVGVVVSYLYAMPTGASVVMVNICAFLLFWALHLFSREKRIMKGIAVVSFLSVVFIAGCGSSKTVTPPKNKVGTASVVLPGTIRLQDAEPVGQTLLSTAPTETPEIINLETAEPPRLETQSGEAPVIEIKEKMFIGQINEIYLNPEDYLGKTFKLEGLFKTEQYPGQINPYCFVLRYGPGCCGSDGNVGFEVAWNRALAKAYPSPDDWVEAVGALQYYEEDGYPYLYIALSSLTVLPDRGTEFVSQ
jgi:zinc transport system permease protein